MVDLARHSFKVRYKGGTADQGLLDGYDGTLSLHGFAQSLQITTHAFLKNEIIVKSTALKGAKLFIKPPRTGSFVSEIIVAIESYPVISTVAATIGGPVFYDFCKLVYRKACGLFDDDEPDTPYVKKMLEREEPFFDELAESLEGSLQRAHRPIGDTVQSVSLERPRSTLITLDDITKDWVNTRDEAPVLDTVFGNVTRFNSVTRNGRAFIEELGRIVPLKPDGDFPAVRLALFTWSLHGSNTELPKRLELQVRKIRSSSGKVKRVLVSDCKRAE